jgi:hypothetical protein
MQPHPEHSDDLPPSRSRRSLLAGGLVAVAIVVIVLLHLFGVIHG